MIPGLRFQASSKCSTFIVNHKDTNNCLKRIYFLIGGFLMRLFDFSLVGNIIDHEVLPWSIILLTNEKSVPKGNSWNMVHGKGASDSHPRLELDYSGDNCWCPCLQLLIKIS